MEERQCGDLIIKAEIKRKPRFKAGSELSSSVNLKRVEVEVNDVSTEDAETFDIKLHFRGCVNAECDC